MLCLGLRRSQDASGHDLESTSNELGFPSQPLLSAEVESVEAVIDEIGLVKRSWFQGIQPYGTKSSHGVVQLVPPSDLLGRLVEDNVLAGALLDELRVVNRRVRHEMRNPFQTSLVTPHLEYHSIAFGYANDLISHGALRSWIRWVQGLRGRKHRHAPEWRVVSISRLLAPSPST